MRMFPLLGTLALTTSLAGIHLVLEPDSPLQPQNSRGMSKERLMALDKDGDGVLSRSELPERLARAIFDRAGADADGDGSLSAAEVDAYLSSQSAGGGASSSQSSKQSSNQGAQDAAGPSKADRFGRAMGELNRVLRPLFRSEFTAETRDDDLANVDALQAALLESKLTFDALAMSEAAIATFGDDEAAFKTAFRTSLLDTLEEAVALERAILKGDSEKATAITRSLIELRNKGHEQFQ